jgi:hypothetical protein
MDIYDALDEMKGIFLFFSFLTGTFLFFLSYRYISVISLKAVNQRHEKVDTERLLTLAGMSLALIRILTITLTLALTL